MIASLTGRNRILLIKSTIIDYSYEIVDSITESFKWLDKTITVVQ